MTVWPDHPQRQIRSKCLQGCGQTFDVQKLFKHVVSPLVSIAALWRFFCMHFDHKIEVIGEEFWENVNERQNISTAVPNNIKFEYPPRFFKHSTQSSFVFRQGCDEEFVLLWYFANQIKYLREHIRIVCMSNDSSRNAVGCMFRCGRLGILNTSQFCHL